MLINAGSPCFESRDYLLYFISSTMIWFSRSTLDLINIVTLCQAWLVLGWMIVTELLQFALPEIYLSIICLSRH